jgi:uncharacterized membrane protein
MQLTLAQGWSVTTMLAVAVVAILLTGAFYFRAFGALDGRRWRMLFGLRVAAILLVVLLLFRPVFSYQNVLVEKPALVFLLDTSASMSIADDASGVARFSQARDKVEKWCEKLKDDFRLLPMAFAERPEPLDGPQSLPGLTPTGKATSLVRALSSASKQFAPAEIAAVILLSDGIHNSAGNPLDITRKLGVVVDCIGVGASLRSNPSYRDIQVTGIDCPDHMILNNVARVVGSIDAIGLGGRVIQVYLDEDGRQIGQAELTLDDAEGSQQVTFEFRPTVKGRHTYTVRVPPVAEEKITQNNQRSVVATVAEAGIRVLYIEGTLRAEYGALVDRFLAKDPDLEFCALVQTRPNVFLKRSNMANLQLAAIPTDQQTIDKFDVFIFGDIDSSYIRPEQQKMFLKRIREGAGLIMLGGYHSLGPGGYGGTLLGEALPVIVGPREIGQLGDSFLPSLTPDGMRHPIFTNIGVFFPTLHGEPKTAGLPPLEGCTRVQRARPGASVLATFPQAGEGQGVKAAGPMPVFAVQPLDRGRIAVFTGDTTRKWQQGPRALDRESPFLRFWGQTVRWLAGRGESVEARASIVASTDKAYYEPGEPIHISATVRDKEGQGANSAKVVASVRGPAGLPEQITLSTVAGPSGHYGGSVEPRGAGGHEVVVEARLGELSLKSDKIPVEIGRPNLEFEKLDLDEKTLGRIAADTGGRYVHIATADHLIDQLDRSQRKKTVYIERKLYWPPGFWLLFVALLTTEWVLRRRYQLR